MPIPSVREGLYELFAADATISGLVDDRIYAERLPDTLDMPALLYTMIDGVPDQAFEGLTGLIDARYQIDVYADPDRQEDIEAIREALMGLTSGYQTVSVNGNTFEIVSISPVDYGRYMPEPDTQDLRYSIDLLVQFGRS